MSEGYEPVRQRVTAEKSKRDRRHVEERLALRFPRLYDAIARRILRLPPHSRLRQMFLRRVIRFGLEASERRDYAAMLLVWDPDSESIFPPQMASLGEPGVKGREARLRWEKQWREEWGDFRYEPEELIDLGDRALLVGRIVGSGAGSGAVVDRDWGLLLTLSSRGVGREQVFFDRGEALAAAGLSE